MLVFCTQFNSQAKILTREAMNNRTSRDNAIESLIRAGIPRATALRGTEYEKIVLGVLALDRATLLDAESYRFIAHNFDMIPTVLLLSQARPNLLTEPNLNFLIRHQNFDYAIRKHLQSNNPLTQEVFNELRPIVKRLRKELARKHEDAKFTILAINLLGKAGLCDHRTSLSLIKNAALAYGILALYKSGLLNEINLASLTLHPNIIDAVLLLRQARLLSQPNLDTLVLYTGHSQELTQQLQTTDPLTQEAFTDLIKTKMKEAFLMGTHPRLGERSEIFHFFGRVEEKLNNPLADKNVLREVFSYLAIK